MEVFKVCVTDSRRLEYMWALEKLANLLAEMYLDEPMKASQENQKLPFCCRKIFFQTPSMRTRQIQH